MGEEEKKEMKMAIELADEALHKVFEVLNDKVPRATYHEALDSVVDRLKDSLGYAEVEFDEEIEARSGGVGWW